MRIRRPASLTVGLFGTSATWTPTRAEVDAAWELLVELVTRTSVHSLADDNGTDRAVLSSLSSLFAETREILRKHGVETARDDRNGNLSLATISMRILNDDLRPFLARWHPRLADERDANTDGEWKAVVGREPGRTHLLFRSELASVRDELRSYIFVLGRAAKASHFAATIDEDVTADEHAVRTVYAHAASSGSAELWGRPRTHMTRWLNIRDLAMSAWHMKTTKDDRDRDVSRTHKITLDLSDRTEVRFDYAADMGDAFDPMMEIGWLAGRKELRYGDGPHNASDVLTRGDLMIFGGDEVYPYATEKIYTNQVDAPLAHALERTFTEADRPGLFAIPGNHDWYGGLRPWRNRFTTSGPEKQYCGWRVHQDASWFSIKLPHGWWVWGLDTFLRGRINHEQRRYFETIAEGLEDGDQVILCTPVPAWRMREDKIEDLVHLDEFVAEVIESKNATARVFLAGDAHVFASFTRRTTRLGVLEHHVTSGGAGAFLHPTHNLSPVVPQTEVPYVREVDTAPFVDGHFWPPRRDTHRTISFGALRQVLDRQSTGFLALVASLHIAYGAVAGHDARRQSTRQADSVLETLRDFVTANPGLLATIVMLLALTAVGSLGANPNTKEYAVVRFARRAGATHGIAQGVSFLVVAVLAHWLASLLDYGGPMTTAIALVGGGLVAGTLSLALLMIYLSMVNRDYRVNDNEAFSFRHLMDGKHFLRCHLDERGDLTIRLIGVERIHRGWADAIRHSMPLPPGNTAGKLVPVATIPWQQTIKRQLDPIEFAPHHNRWIAISVSDPDPDPTAEINEEIKFIAELLVEALLRLGCNLSYGGDPRQGGFTEQFVQLAREPIGYRIPRVRNYRPMGSSPARVGDMGGVELIPIEGPTDRADQLTAMRQRITDETFARIVVGGKTAGSSGRMPGIVEETLISCRAQQPLFIIGGLGGAAQTALDRYIGANFGQLRNELSDEENRELATSRESHRIVYLVTKGLQQLYETTPATS